MATVYHLNRETRRKKKYLELNQNNDDEISDSDSNADNLEDVYHELNNIYLKCYKNLKQFFLLNKDLKGVRLQGNKFLENISLEQFNSLFLKYGKGLEKKLKRQVLNYFYPNDNNPKLMGEDMNLTPIPIKRQIYIKNQKEKNDYKNAERAAVIMRRLEYTHGLGIKKHNDKKIYFYLMKGAVLIIEDWWIKVMKRRGNINIGNKNMDNMEINEE